VSEFNEPAFRTMMRLRRNVNASGKQRTCVDWA
jgi:hypothetical protein